MLLLTIFYSEMLGWNKPPVIHPLWIMTSLSLGPHKVDVSTPHTLLTTGYCLSQTGFCVYQYLLPYMYLHGWCSG